MQRNGRDQAQSGIAMLAVMWTVTAMLLIASVFSNSVQIETRASIYRKEAAQARAMACGGIEAAIFEMAYPLPADREKPSGTWKRGQREWTVLFRGGRAELRIVNETGKLDLNAAGRRQLIRLFEARGLEGTAAARLATAIIHWRSPAGADDPESQALEDYYSRAGYRPAHAPFTSVEEVLRVRGMTRDIFYGTVDVTDRGTMVQKHGVGQDLTVFSGSAQINMNYAAEAVLVSLPGMNPEMARAIVEERRKKPFESISEAGDRLAASLPEESLPFLTTADSNTYSIVSVGRVAGSEVRRAVRAMVQLAPQGASQYRTVAWYDDDISE